MTPCIDIAKLESAAEHLEWVLSCYAGRGDTDALYAVVLPLIECAKAGLITACQDRSDFPAQRALAEGIYADLEDPSVEEALVEFSMQLRGGLCKREERLIAKNKNIEQRTINHERARSGTCTIPEGCIMNQAINPTKLKAAAEYFEQVLAHYANNDQVNGLRDALRLLLDDAKSCRLTMPMGMWDVPGAWHIADGTFRDLRDPNFERAYGEFATELQGGWSDRERTILDKMARMRRGGEA